MPHLLTTATSNAPSTVAPNPNENQPQLASATECVREQMKDDVSRGTMQGGSLGKSDATGDDRHENIEGKARDDREMAALQSMLQLPHSPHANKDSMPRRNAAGTEELSRNSEEGRTVYQDKTQAAVVTPKSGATQRGHSEHHGYDRSQGEHHCGGWGYHHHHHNPHYHPHHANAYARPHHPPPGYNPPPGHGHPGYAPSYAHHHGPHGVYHGPTYYPPHATGPQRAYGPLAPPHPNHGQYPPIPRARGAPHDGMVGGYRAHNYNPATNGLHIGAKGAHYEHHEDQQQGRKSFGDHGGDDSTNGKSDSTDMDQKSVQPSMESEQAQRNEEERVSRVISPSSIPQTSKTNQDDAPMPRSPSRGMNDREHGEPGSYQYGPYPPSNYYHMHPPPPHHYPPPHHQGMSYYQQSYPHGPQSHGPPSHVMQQPQQQHYHPHQQQQGHTGQPHRMPPRNAPPQSHAYYQGGTYPHHAHYGYDRYFREGANRGESGGVTTGESSGGVEGAPPISPSSSTASAGKQSVDGSPDAGTKASHPQHRGHSLQGAGVNSVSQWQHAHGVTGTAPSANKCVPLKGPIPSKFWGDIEKAKDAYIPAFDQLVNFPDYLPKNAPNIRSLHHTSVTTYNHIDGTTVTKHVVHRHCVMCGKSCLCTASSSGSAEHISGMSASKVQVQQGKAGGEHVSGGQGNSSSTSPIIPRQNKGLCTKCDVAVWIVTQSGLEIKWCKGCKNFRPWAAFGDKGLATKCVKCRERQKEKYAAQKEAAAAASLKRSKSASSANSCTNDDSSTSSGHKRKQTGADQEDDNAKKDSAERISTDKRLKEDLTNDQKEKNGSMKAISSARYISTRSQNDAERENEEEEGWEQREEKEAKEQKRLDAAAGLSHLIAATSQM